MKIETNTCSSSASKYESGCVFLVRMCSIFDLPLLLTPFEQYIRLDVQTDRKKYLIPLSFYRIKTLLPRSPLFSLSLPMLLAEWLTARPAGRFLQILPAASARRRYTRILVGWHVTLTRLACRLYYSAIQCS